MREGPGEQRIEFALANAQEERHKFALGFAVAIERRGERQLVAVAAGEEWRRKDGRLLSCLAIIELFL